MKENKKIKALLFDLDGVIIDSFEAWYLAFNATLREFRREEMSREEFSDKCWGPDLRYNLEVLNLDESATEYCIRQQMGLIEKIELFEGVKSLLKHLKKGYKVGLVTNNPKKENVYRILEHFNILSCFDAIVTGDDVKKGKPDPEIVIKACEMLKVSSKNTMLVGDTESDFVAGKSVGCIVVGIEEGEGKRKRKRLDSEAEVGTKAETDVTIKNIFELFHAMQEKVVNSE